MRLGPRSLLMTLELTSIKSMWPKVSFFARNSRPRVKLLRMTGLVIGWNSLLMNWPVESCGIPPMRRKEVAWMIA